MDHEKLGNRIREERLKLHLTQMQLSEDVGISDSHMGAIERGDRGLTLDKLEKIANRLGVTIDYLLADSISGSNDVLIEQFRQITDGHSMKRKQMAVNILRNIFAELDKEKEGD